MLKQGRRSWPARLSVVAVCAGAGLLFATTASTARGTDLRPGERGDSKDLLRREHQLVAEADARLRALRADQRPIEETTLAAAVGLEAVTGPGLTVVLDDASAAARAAVDPDTPADYFVVHQQDVQGVLNALWAGGAEAVQVMDQRLIATSAVRCVGPTLLLKGRVYPPPYVLTAIGPADGMRAALDASPEVQLYREYVDKVGLRYDVDARKSVTLPAYEGPLGIGVAEVAPARGKQRSAESPAPRAG